MREPRLLVRMLHSAAAWSLAWVFAAAVYLLLIDITDLPELIVGVGAAVLAATGAELAREQHLAGLAARLRWLARLPRPILKAPSDIAIVSAVAVRQLLAPRAVTGGFRAVPFRCGPDEALETGKQALAESLGSFAPNTIIIGVDPERELILAHQLHRTGGAEEIDVMGLG